MESPVIFFGHSPYDRYHCQVHRKIRNNIFAKLGFAKLEAAGLKRQAKAEIAQLTLSKGQLMRKLSGWVAEEYPKLSATARILGVSRPRVSDVVNLKAGKFTLDALVQMLGRAGRQVKVVLQD